MSAAALAGIITLLSEAPQIFKSAAALWQSLSTLHSNGLLNLTPDQIAAMNAAGTQLNADIAALQAAAGQKPTT